MGLPDTVRHFYKLSAYEANLNSRLAVNNLRTLNLNIGEIYSSSLTGNDFEVGNWTESDQIIDL